MDPFLDLSSLYRALFGSLDRSYNFTCVCQFVRPLVESFSKLNTPKSDGPDFFENSFLSKCWPKGLRSRVFYTFLKILSFVFPKSLLILHFPLKTQCQNSCSGVSTYKVVLSLMVSVVRHAQSTKNKKFAISLQQQYFKKEVRDKYDFLHEDKQKSSLQAENIVFTGHCQICPKYPKQKVFVISPQNLKKEGRDKVDFQYEEKQIFLQVDPINLDRYGQAFKNYLK